MGWFILKLDEQKIAKTQKKLKQQQKDKNKNDLEVHYLSMLRTDAPKLGHCRSQTQLHFRF